MTPEILPLLAASLSCVSALGFFARHNQRSGWVKPRRASLEELVAAEMDWKNYPAPIRNAVPAAPAVALPPSFTDVTNFTLQLAHFHDALAVASVKPVADREHVSV